VVWHRLAGQWPSRQIPAIYDCLVVRFRREDCVKKAQAQPRLKNHCAQDDEIQCLLHYLVSSLYEHCFESVPGPVEKCFCLNGYPRLKISPSRSSVIKLDEH
jgi:hypothetical protein